jgi:hypothetical protein
MYDSLCITADQDNSQSIFVSDYSEDKQENSNTELDYIELTPRGELHLPWNREISALNRPMVMGAA